MIYTHVKELGELSRQLPTAQVGGAIWPMLVFFFVGGLVKDHKLKRSSQKPPPWLGERQERVGCLCIPQCSQGRERYFFVKNCQTYTKWKGVSLLFALQKTPKNQNRLKLAEHLEPQPVSKTTEITQRPVNLF